MNKKAAIEMTIGTIVIIILSMSILILGMVLIKNIFYPEPEFKITIEECWNKTISYGTLHFENGDSGWSNASVNSKDTLICWIEEQKYITADNYGDITCDIRHSVEKCKDMEVEDWFFICDNRYRNNCTLIDYENSFKDIFGKCKGNNIVCEEDLTIEWLGKNCECLNIMLDSFSYKLSEWSNYSGKWDNCFNYKCGEYKVEVLE